jgi:DNA-binding FadR family transcriptional regulator
MREAVGDADRFYAADVEFHLSIFAASGNTLIDRLSTILGPLLEASFRSQRYVQAARETLVAVHEAVYKAIVDGDGERARRSMESLLIRAGDQVSKAAANLLEKAG